MRLSTTTLFIIMTGTLSITTYSAEDMCHSVAVIGGGVGGTYTAWKLRQKGLSVGLYEFSDRLGGRFFTHRFHQAPDIPIELGAMRFTKDEHPILYRAVHEIGLQTREFAAHNHLSEEASFFLRGKYFRNRDFRTNHVPYNLHPNEKGGILKIYRYLQQRTNFSGDLSSLHKEMPSLVSEDGVRLTHQTIQEFLRKYLSEEAVEVITNVFKFNLYNISAATVFHFMSYNDAVPIYDMLTISGGMQQLPEELVRQFLSASTKHSLHLNHQLVSITKKRSETYTLKFMKTRTVDGKTIPTGAAVIVCSRRVILAVTPSALLQIHWEGLHSRHILSHLNTVNYLFGVKIYLLYDFPWWLHLPSEFDSHCKSENSNNYISINCPRSATQYPDDRCDKYRTMGPNINSDLPLDMTFEYGISNKTGKAVLLAAYSLQNVWRDLQKHGNGINQEYHRASAEVIRHAHLYLAKLYSIPVTDVPTPSDGIISRWDAYPFGAPFCGSKAGNDWEKVWRTIHKPSLTDEIFIASGSYSKRMSDAFAEYSLAAIEEIIKDYF